MNRIKRTGWWIGIAGVLASGIVLAGEGGIVSLDHCIRAALEASPDLQGAEARLEAARAAVRDAQSAYYPQVSLGANWMRTDNPPQAFFMELNQRTASLEKDFNNPDDTENTRGSVSARWRLYDGGRREADGRAARLTGEAAARMTEAARNELIFQVTRAYYGVLQATAFMEIQREAVASVEESLRVAKERLSAGSAIRTDVLNLEVQHSQAREDLIRVTNGRKLAVAALNTAVGREVLAESAVVPVVTTVEPLQRMVVAERDVEQRPELAGIRLQERATEAMAQRARRDYYPVISAFGSADWDSQSMDNFEQSYIVGAAAELNVFDGFHNRAALAGAKAMHRSAQAMNAKVRNQLLLDLKQAKLREEESWERMGVAEKSVTSAEEALRITKERYQQGASDITELLTAQVGRTATRSRWVAAYYDYKVALSDVDRASGKLEFDWREKASDAPAKNR
jgi:outer membrane protein